MVDLFVKNGMEMSLVSMDLFNRMISQFLAFSLEVLCVFLLCSCEFERVLR